MNKLFALCGIALLLAFSASAYRGDAWFNSPLKSRQPLGHARGSGGSFHK